MTEEEELTNELIRRVKENDHSTIPIAKCYKEYKFLKEEKKTLYRIIKSFKDMGKSKYKEFLKNFFDAPISSTNVERLMEYKECLDFVEFFKGEIELIEDKILEFKIFMYSGNLAHLLETVILNKKRVGEDLLDSRE